MLGIRFGAERAGSAVGSVAGRSLRSRVLALPSAGRPLFYERDRVEDIAKTSGDTQPMLEGHFETKNALVGSNQLRVCPRMVSH
jgi:hypothetical protein